MIETKIQFPVESYSPKIHHVQDPPTLLRNIMISPGGFYSYGTGKELYFHIVNPFMPEINIYVTITQNTKTQVVCFGICFIALCALDY